jgi:hypothetical protein
LPAKPALLRSVSSGSLSVSSGPVSSIDLPTA